MLNDILRWPITSVGFFLFVAGAATLAPGSEGRLGRRFVGLTLAGLFLSLAAVVLPHRAILHDWVLPPLLLLLAYWSSGALYAAPMPGAEVALMRMDSALGVRSIAARIPRPLAEWLELSYAGVYALIPAALLLHLFVRPRPNVEGFWSVVLLTDYICFATLPWIQTRPPRALEGGAPWRARLRAVNERLLDTASIGANTFPSGHAAEALAAALLVTGGPWPVVAMVFIAAISVSAGAVLGRYHYALDALAGWAVAAVVWWLVA